jgi:hypothetical protein
VNDSPTTPSSPPPDARRYHALNALAACTLGLLAFCLVWRPTAWIGLSAAVLVLGTLFFYHYCTRAQLGLLEFVLTIAALGQAFGATLKLLWPAVRDTEFDWLLLGAWFAEAAWLLGGALWAGWVIKVLGFQAARHRLLVLLVGWLAPIAVAVLPAAVFLSFIGIPTWVLESFGSRRNPELEVLYGWWVLLMPVAAGACFWSLREASGLHRTAKALDREAEEARARAAPPPPQIAPSPVDPPPGNGESGPRPGL